MGLGSQNTSDGPLQILFNSEIQQLMGSDPNYQSLKNEIEHVVQFARNNEFIN